MKLKIVWWWDRHWKHDVRVILFVSWNRELI